jgi:hypothetical protein
MVYVSMLRMALDPGNNILKGKALWLSRWYLPASAPIPTLLALLDKSWCMTPFAWCSEICSSYTRTVTVHCRHYVENVISFMVYNNHDNYVTCYSRSYSERFKSKQERKHMYNVTLRHILATNVAVDKE